jgi:hypothetical protein
MRNLPERAEKAGQALLQLGGRAPRGDIGRLAGFDHNKQARAIKDLLSAGLVRPDGNEVELTPEGRQRFSPLARPDAGRLDEALGFWPQRHRAVIDLLLSGVVARHHLRELDLPPGFVLIGPTGMGKTSVASVVMELLGLDPAEHTVMVPQQTEGDLFGRTAPVEGGAYAYVPAPATRRPMVLFDEFDKADHGVRLKVWTYFDDRRHVMRGEQLVELAPVPVIAANYAAGADRYAQLRAEYLRRSIVVDFAGDRATVAHLEDHLRDFYQPPERPWFGAFPLKALEPPEVDPRPARSLLASVPRLLNGAGLERWVGARGLEALLRGRAAFYPEATVSELAVMTVTDYLTCVESVEGLVDPRWLGAIEAVADQVARASRAEIEARLAAAHQARAERAQQARAGRVRAEEEDIAHVGRRSEFVAGLVRRWEGLDGRRLHKDFRANPALHDRTIGVREQLSRLKASAAKAGRTRLAELEQLSRRPLAAADELIARNEQLRRAEEHQRQEERAMRAAARARHPAAAIAAKQQARQRRDYLRGYLATVLGAVRPLEGLWGRRSTRKEERPFQVLRNLKTPDGQPLLVFEERQRSQRKGLLAEVGNAMRAGQGIWRSTVDPEVRFTGTATTCPALDAWGANTRRVLEPLIGLWHRREDTILAELGKAAHRRRPSVRPSQSPSNVRQLRPPNHPALTLPTHPVGDW